MKVGLCGLGTVGGGTFNVLLKNKKEIAARSGMSIEIVQVASRQVNPACDLTGLSYTQDIFEVADNPEVDVLVELIGGTTVAKELVLRAINNGKHIVTANKALIAVHGNEIFELAKTKGVTVAFEAAVAGGIPIIKALREGLAANEINWLAGIINGTGNFILTEMRDKGRTFGDVLKEAQALGYAEADPTFDVEGIDAAHKLTILASVAFGIPLQFERAYTEGISQISPEDVKYAEEFGYRIKHLGLARRTDHGVELRVHPTLIPEDQLIAKVDGVMNAVVVDGDAVGQTLYYGAGAGDKATASAVVADLIDIARARKQGSNVGAPSLGHNADQMNDLAVMPIEEITSAYYLRMLVEDHPGTLARIATILSDHSINIESISQKEKELHDGLIPMIMLTHIVSEKSMNHAIQAIEGLTDVKGTVKIIRVASFEN